MKKAERDSILVAVVEQSTNAIILTDISGNIEYVNKRFTEMTGYMPNEVIGVNPKILKFGKNANEFCNQIWSTLKRGNVWTGEIESKKKTGELYWEFLSIKPIVDRNNKITHFLGISRDVTEQKKKEEALEKFACTDPLTGLVNQRIFFDALKKTLSGSERHQKSFSLMFIDLNRLKQINDKFGHGTGDEVIKTVAGKLKKCTRESDVLARIGGDEFTIIIPDAKNQIEATAVAKKILNEFSLPLTTNEGSQYNISVSIGISIYPSDGRTPAALTHSADKAMYTAKKLGRNNKKSNFIFYNSI